MSAAGPGIGRIVRLGLVAVPALLFALYPPALTLADHDSLGMALPECSTSSCDRCCGDMRIIVNLRRNTVGDTEVMVKGASVTQKELVRKLLVFAERIRDMDDPQQHSLVSVLIRAEAGLPWGDIRAVLDACEDPDVRIYRIQFATQPIRR